MIITKKSYKYIITTMSDARLATNLKHDTLKLYRPLLCPAEIKGKSWLAQGHMESTLAHLCITFRQTTARVSKTREPYVTYSINEMRTWWTDSLQVPSNA